MIYTWGFDRRVRIQIEVSIPNDELPPSLSLTSDYVKLCWVLLMPSAEMSVCERQ